MNEGLVVAVANDVNLKTEDTSSVYLDNNEEESCLPQDFAYVGSLC